VLIANNSKLAHSMPFHYLCADTQGMLGVYVISFFIYRSGTTNSSNHPKPFVVHILNSKITLLAALTQDLIQAYPCRNGYVQTRYSAMHWQFNQLITTLTC